jgi:DNA uptake protein ComE-like DNA-binding protein
MFSPTCLISGHGPEADFTEVIGSRLVKWGRAPLFGVPRGAWVFGALFLAILLGAGSAQDSQTSDFDASPPEASVLIGDEQVSDPDPDPDREDGLDAGDDAGDRGAISSGSGSVASESLVPTGDTQGPPTSSSLGASTVGPTRTTTSTSTTSSTSTTRTTSTTLPVVSAVVGLSDLERLRVEAEPSRQGYARSLFPHWNDTNGSGCNARQDVLRAQVVGFAQVDLFDRCVIIEADWYSLFDGITHSGSPSELDVDHVVSLAEAWDSGAWAWDRTRRRAFANDPINLLAVTAASNRSKGDRDAGEWLPPQRSAWCMTAQIMVQTKLAYDLSVDSREKRGLSTMLATCAEPGQRVVPGVLITSVSPTAPAGTQTTTVTSTTVTSTTVPSTTVPSTTVTPTTVPSTTAPAAPSECVNINNASIQDLTRIVHIGTVRAEEIVRIRPFRTVDDLTRVSGIGQVRLQDIVAQGLACV